MFSGRKHSYIVLLICCQYGLISNFVLMVFFLLRTCQESACQAFISLNIRGLWRLVGSCFLCLALTCTWCRRHSSHKTIIEDESIKNEENNEDNRFVERGSL